MQTLVFYYLLPKPLSGPSSESLLSSPETPAKHHWLQLCGGAWGKGKPEQMLNSFSASVYCPVIGGNNKTIFTSSAKSHLSNSI